MPGTGPELSMTQPYQVLLDFEGIELHQVNRSQIILPEGIG